MKIRSEFFFVLFVLAIAAMLLVPLPTPVIDILIVLNLAFSFLILLISLYLPNALSLLSFPTLLLLSTLFRLALNVASSRLILAQGDAGVVIEAFGTLLVGGQLAVGIIIFVIITVVNFIVIAKGSARVSEVAARFALDALPGKQATIDSDLRAGLIDGRQAQARREALRKESQLYGAMDGSMKFVQGDAIAGFLIILTNIIGGLSIALGDGMPLGEAFETYTILTVGDGLVAQVPALLIAICAGIVVTRVSSTDTATLGEDVAGDLLARPGILVVVGGLLSFFALLPGVPFLPFVGVGGVIAFVGLQRMRTASGLLAAEGSGLASLRAGVGEQLSGGRPAAALPGSSRQALLPGPLGVTGERASGAMLDGVTSSREQLRSFDGRPNARIKILLDRHALFSTFERSLGEIYARWSNIQDLAKREFGITLPELWIGADVAAQGGSVSIELDGIALTSERLKLDAVLVAIEPSHARAMGVAVLGEASDPLTGRSLSWVSMANLTLVEPFQKFDALDWAMRFLVHYLLRHPEELVSISDTHTALAAVEASHAGLFEAVLDPRFINPARATEVKRELLRAGLYVGDDRKLIEDLAHYCATYAKSELAPSDFDLGDIVRHIRMIRLRELAAGVRAGKSSSGTVPVVSMLSDFNLESSRSTDPVEVREVRAVLRGGAHVIVCEVEESRVLADSRALEAALESVQVLSQSELIAANLRAVRFYVWG